MKAKLIKRTEVQQQSNRRAIAKKAALPVKTATEVVRGWIGEHQQSQQSPRQAFTELFSKSRLRRA